MSNALTITDNEYLSVLQNSLYPGASIESIKLVMDYCRAAKLDVMQKPVHIVPMWDNKAGRMKDVIMPGIGMYRMQASRTGNYAGMSEPEFGPDVTETIDGVTVTYPAWCKIVVKRVLADGMIAEFPAIERWKENYAVKGGKEKSIAPNAMWTKRPYGQLAKCTEAQALRKAWPEHGSAPTAEEMEGKIIEIDMGAANVVSDAPVVSRTQSVKDRVRGRQAVAQAAQGPHDVDTETGEVISAPAWTYDEIIAALGSCEDAERFADLQDAGRSVYGTLDKEQKAALTKAINAVKETLQC